MEYSTIIAGSGGQGVMLIGKLFGKCAFYDGKEVALMPAYGTEQRGGTANITITVSDEEICTPVTSSPDCVCAMNQPSVDRFYTKIRRDGMLIYNSSLASCDIERNDIKVVAVPCVELAGQIHSSRSANFVMFGALAACTSVSDALAIDLIKNSMKKKPHLIDVNLKAFDLGYEYVSK